MSEVSESAANENGASNIKGDPAFQRIYRRWCDALTDELLPGKEWVDPFHPMSTGKQPMRDALALGMACFIHQQGTSPLVMYHDFEHFLSLAGEYKEARDGFGLPGLLHDVILSAHGEHIALGERSIHSAGNDAYQEIFREAKLEEYYEPVRQFINTAAREARERHPGIAGDERACMAFAQTVLAAIAEPERVEQDTLPIEALDEAHRRAIAGTLTRIAATIHFGEKDTDTQSGFQLREIEEGIGVTFYANERRDIVNDAIEFRDRDILSFSPSISLEDFIRGSVRVAFEALSEDARCRWREERGTRNDNHWIAYVPMDEVVGALAKPAAFMGAMAGREEEEKIQAGGNFFIKAEPYHACVDERKFPEVIAHYLKPERYESFAELTEALRPTMAEERSLLQDLREDEPPGVAENFEESYAHLMARVSASAVERMIGGVMAYYAFAAQLGPVPAAGSESGPTSSPRPGDTLFSHAPILFSVSEGGAPTERGLDTTAQSGNLDTPAAVAVSALREFMKGGDLAAKVALASERMLQEMTEGVTVADVGKAVVERISQGESSTEIMNDILKNGIDRRPREPDWAARVRNVTESEPTEKGVRGVGGR